MKKKPRVCILKTDGTNCDAETLYAFEKAGGECRLVHVNEFRSSAQKLRDYQILAIPGGFSYGDDVVSGKILAIELLSFFKAQLREFVAAGNLVIGICNGFQVLVRTGLLPFNNLDSMNATLAHNDSGSFVCKWVDLVVQPSACVFTRWLEGSAISLQVANGEGRYFARDGVLHKLEEQGQVPLRYAHDVNGSSRAIAGVCDPSGRIFGLMPHPERFVDPHQFYNWRRFPDLKPHGLPIFENGVSFAAENLI